MNKFKLLFSKFMKIINQYKYNFVTRYKEKYSKLYLADIIFLYSHLLVIITLLLLISIVFNIILII